VSERSDEPLEAEDAAEETPEPVEDDEEERWGGEESLGLLPAD
jgi:hypothetical protein